MPSNNRQYCGRFAPSPTGPLHFGSLIAATGSYLEAQVQQGLWRLRIEDIDPPREMQGAADTIQRTLEAYGFAWDGATEFQSRRTEAYEAAFQQLHAAGRVFACGCSRKTLALQDTEQYPGTCRQQMQGQTLRSWRLKVDDVEVGFTDGLLGPFSQTMQSIGDFVLKRADGHFSYNLAVAVDDASTGITHVVRGADLLEMTFPQLYIQSLLGLPSPQYTHLPVAMDENQAKLSKQNLAPALATTREDIVNTLYAALAFLDQHPPAELLEGNIDEIWAWAAANWRLNAITKIKKRPAFAANIK